MVSFEPSLFSSERDACNLGASEPGHPQTNLRKDLSILTNKKGMSVYLRGKAGPVLAAVLQNGPEQPLDLRVGPSAFSLVLVEEDADVLEPLLLLQRQRLTSFA